MNWESVTSPTYAEVTQRIQDILTRQTQGCSRNIPHQGAFRTTCVEI